MADIVCGTNAQCTLEPAGTYGNANSSATYPANQVMRVRITVTPTGAQLVQAGTTAGVQYPATITSISTTTFKDADEGLTLDLAGSADKVINATSGNAAIAPAPNTVAPTATSASGSADVLTTTWSEGILGLNAAGFTVHAPADGTCAGAAVATGDTFTSNNGDQQLGVSLSNPLPPATYFYKVIAGSVRDIDGNGNAATTCTAVTFTT
jgi:hypothetical protein